MSRTVREWALEKLEAAENAQRKSIEYIDAIRVRYDQPGYEIISLAVSSIQEIQIAVLEQIETARREFP